MIEVNQPGKPTYKRNKITWIFEPELEKELYTKLVNEISSSPDISTIQSNIRDKYFTILTKKYDIYASCYGDGWHIDVVKWNGVAISKLLKEKIFGDINMNYIWTQETGKVVGIIKQLYKELK